MTAPIKPAGEKKPDKKMLASWRHHLQDEIDAAYFYNLLAENERQTQKRDIFRRLSEVESRHVELLRKLLLEHGQQPPQYRPSLRARVMVWVSRRLGYGFLLAQLLREEGREVKGYLNLFKNSPTPSSKNITYKLARESMEHAEALKGITGQEGEPWHQIESGGFLRNVVYGFNDGLTANFGLVAGVVGAAVAPHIILISGLAGAIADALSMGSSGYLAAKSELEVQTHEIAMEKEEIALMPHLEEEELALIYQAKGLGEEQAKQMAENIMSDPERALEEKVREELGIGTPHTTPLKEGLITGSATAFGAFIPVAPFIFLEGIAAMWVSFIISMLSHFAVGAARSLFTGRGIIRSGMDMFIVGLGIAIAGYFVGDVLIKLLQ